MTPFLNPFFTGKILKHYITDVNRAWKKTPVEIQRYQDKALRRTLQYAYTVPLYHEKYRAAGIHPRDIKGIADLPRVPIMTKDEIIKGFPEKIVPPRFQKEKAYLVGTSGSSGRPMQMYKDLEYVMIEALGGVRQLRAYGMNWRRTRITNIGDFSIPKTTDQECLEKGLMGNLSGFFSLQNYQHLYTGEEARVLLDTMASFNPELVIGYISVLMGIASLKRQGLGKGLRPRYIIGSGEVLDPYSRRYIQEGFGAPMFNLYATTEGGSIAFECPQSHFHVNNDFVHVEILDKDLEPVTGDDFGSIVITRLYSGGTPIVRYTGLHDLGSLEEKTCECGMHTPLLKNLEGRKKDAIILPDGRIFPPATIPMPLAEAADSFHTSQIKRFQFIQKEIDEILITVEIDEQERGHGVSVNRLFEEIQKRYHRVLGDRVHVTVQEVNQVRMPPGMLFPPLIISRVKRQQIQDSLL